MRKMQLRPLISWQLGQVAFCWDIFVAAEFGVHLFDNVGHLGVLGRPRWFPQVMYTPRRNLIAHMLSWYKLHTRELNYSFERIKKTQPTRPKIHQLSSKSASCSQPSVDLRC